ncbi:DNA alkylation repair protein [Candidatus Pacearchaeota archaeon CG1_02_32_132]|nr:MAG: DNA alkylation repair protein [Candidatus Pacearchaeota archaeon CG1_02_32_132]
MDLRKEIRKLSNPEKAKAYARFFKTGKDEYGEGDKFLGLTVPESREIAKKFIDLDLNEINEHLKSEWHEERLIALLILVEKYNKNPIDRKKIFDFYLSNLEQVNNWDLVDLSASRIAGHFLFYFGKDYEIYKMLLRKMAESENLWVRRVAIISTLYSISQNKFEDTLEISRLLLSDKHDLIHKAVGWMLREVGKRDEKVLKDFLKDNYSELPRTTLRYAIERFPEDERKKWLGGSQ